MIGLGADVLDELSDSLLDAKRRAGVGELTVLQSWLPRNQWSRYYREKFDQQADRDAWQLVLIYLIFGRKVPTTS